jgi:hypothetical protein
MERWLAYIEDEIRIDLEELPVGSRGGDLQIARSEQLHTLQREGEECSGCPRIV